jgi:autotransporter-associated beta strand protein
MGSSTELTLSGGNVAGGSYGGAIAGEGSVVVAVPFDSQTFSGNNTYTGTTTVNGGPLRINGTTSGQGNYTVAATGTLTGSGTIGLATNGTISLGGAAAARLSAGGDLTPGTLHVVTSGTGGVIFGSQSVFLADIGPAGASDLVAIAGGYIDLTGSTDTLTLNGLAGAFDGSAYTIAIFTENLGSGAFNTVTGLPSNYTVAYLSTSIMLLPIPEPATWGFAGQALVILCWRWLRNRKKPSVA